MTVLRTIPLRWPAAAVRFSQWRLQGHSTVCERCSCLPVELTLVQRDSGIQQWLCPSCLDYLELLKMPRR